MLCKKPKILGLATTMLLFIALAIVFFVPITKAQQIDIATINLRDAILMGNINAKYKVIIFTCPNCPFCRKFHTEKKKVLEKRPDIAFYIKFFPLNKNAYLKSKSIACQPSPTSQLSMLDDNFTGKPIPKIDCDSKMIQNNRILAQSLGITGVPMIILPSSKIHTGYLPANRLINLIKNNK